MKVVGTLQKMGTFSQLGAHDEIMKHAFIAENARDDTPDVLWVLLYNPKHTSCWFGCHLILPPFLKRKFRWTKMMTWPSLLFGACSPVMVDIFFVKIRKIFTKVILRDLKAPENVNKIPIKAHSDNGKYLATFLARIFRLVGIME